jgi:predicted transcriptional regulator of viral defense system
MPRSSTINRLAAIAEDQWGLVTRRQAELAGIPRRTLDRLTAGGKSLERVAQGVYRLTGAPTPDHLELRAAWLQLAPGVPAWKRAPEQGVISHRSAAALYGLGNLPADRHEFTVATRKQSRRKDVRLHHRKLEKGEWGDLRGLPVTRPSRIASDLLFDNEDTGAVAQIVAEAIREIYDYPGTFADALAPHARKFGLRKGDGIALLGWFLELVGDPNTPRWLEEARAHVDRTHAKEAAPKERSG